MYLPFMIIGMDRAKRTKIFEGQLPDAIDTMKHALKAGHPLGASLMPVAEEFADGYLSSLEKKYSHWKRRRASLTYVDHQLWVEVEEKPSNCRSLAFPKLSCGYQADFCT